MNNKEVINKGRNKNNKRNVSRIKAMIRLYQYDLLNSKENIDTFDELINEFNESIENNSVDSITYDKTFEEEIYNKTLENLSKIDRQIAISLENYPLDRVSYVDRALLRVGTYEIMFTDTPTPIIINEIINLSKDYSEVDKVYSSKFNNGVLDRIARNVRK